jgi:large subunit ribosomal protein L53
MLLPGLAVMPSIPRPSFLFTKDESPSAPLHAATANMMTRFLTSVSTAFSPFNPKSGKTARNFLALLPPNARSTMKIDIKQLPRSDADKPAVLALTFSIALPPTHAFVPLLTMPTEDGKEMNLDLEQLKIKDIMTEVDRHSRMLGRKEELAG